MKDRFKFRVWDKENFNYLEFEGFKKGEIEFNFDIDTNSIWIEFDHNKYILEQCTGLKDKNGKLIYEGDILKENWHIYKLEWGNGAYTIKDIKRGTSYMFTSGLCIEKSEVIGNIYENPELLESN